MAPQDPDEPVSSTAEPQHSITLIINGCTYQVGAEVPPWTRLVDYIREKVKLPGTKKLCREGGCGVCTVVATLPDPEDEHTNKTFSIHSCQMLVYACAGWKIETIEHLGNRYDGYHPLQKALHGFYGTQCGYCSPGMIMNMYGQMESSATLTAMQVERSLDGNICRCTGYRPILDAFKSLAVDGDQKLKNKLVDIEESYKDECMNKDCRGCSWGKKDGKSCTKDPSPITINSDIQLTVGSVSWYRPVTLTGVYNILKTLSKNEKVRIVVGNTGQGVFKNDGPYSAYIATGGIKELNFARTGSPLEMGANVSLTRAIETFRHMADSVPGYEYMDTLITHWQVVANVSVRNIGCWAGNLMMKHAHKEFQSDIFLTLLAVDAILKVGHAENASVTCMNLEQFLETDMSRSIILSITLPPAPANTKLCTFKITPRAVNAHAYINACFKMEVDPTVGYKVTKKPTILLGGINPQFIHATQTEEYLNGQKLSDEVTVREAVKILGSEVKPDSQPQDASPEYRKALAQSLLYKTIVGFLGDQVCAKFRSAALTLKRPMSSGHQSFDMNNETWPVGEPVPKLESAVQISGEALYLDDVPYLPNELHAAFVQTRVANAKIKSIDTTRAMNVAGVEAFVTAADIPGKNSFVVNAASNPDPVFVEDYVKYAGQPVGLLVAKDRDTALHAARLVTVEYEDVKKPVLTIKEALKEGRYQRACNCITGKCESYKFGDPEGGLKNSPHRLMGELSQGTQYHFSMEAISARVVPTEDGYDIFSTSQWPTETQNTAAHVLGVPANSINVSVRRLGGGFGGKISRQNLLSTAAAVAARKVKQPVRIVADLDANMTLVGWREPYYSRYEVGFDNSGKLISLKVDMTSDAGHVTNEVSVSFACITLQNAYHIPNLEFIPYVVNTDTAANTWCRAPGHVEAVGTIENIMEHVANYLKKDVLEVRLINMVLPQVPRLLIPPHERNVMKEDILPLLMEKSSYFQRRQEVVQFNTSNKWKKRGLSLLPLHYSYEYLSVFHYGMQVSIYEYDGTVAVSHGGIEMGQGINTKVAQMVAYVLGVPLNQVVVKSSDTLVGANSSFTGGSHGSDLCAHGVKKACTAIRQRMDVVKEKLKLETGKEPTWLELVKKCHVEDVNLSEHYWTAIKEFPHGYDIWGACCLEVEIDVLTGMYMIRRADIVEDSGRSMNPYVDVGQVEGAFIMGIGMYTSELVKYNPETGQKLSSSTWEYKPPTALDIPIDFRIILLPNAKNPHGVLGSKATGEPPLCLSYSVVTALRNAISAFRAESGDDSWFPMDTPITVEKVHQLCGISTAQFQLYKSESLKISSDEGFRVPSNGDVTPTANNAN